MAAKKQITPPFHRYQNEGLYNHPYVIAINAPAIMKVVAGGLEKTATGAAIMKVVAGGLEKTATGACGYFSSSVV